MGGGGGIQTLRREPCPYQFPVPVVLDARQFNVFAGRGGLVTRLVPAICGVATNQAARRKTGRQVSADLDIGAGIKVVYIEYGFPRASWPGGFGLRIRIPVLGQGILILELGGVDHPI